MRGIRAAASIVCLGAWAGCTFEGPSAGGPREDAPQADAPAPDAPAPDAPYAPACMTDPSYSNNGEHRYKVIPRDVDYDTAIDACGADGAHLAVIDSSEENDYLRARLGANDAWIGLDDLTVDGTFRWITGATGAFRRFPGGEPNDYNGEDCTLLQSGGSWNDAGCEYERRPVCECDPAYRPPPTPLCRTAATGFVLESGRRLFPRTTPRTWQEAEDDCRSIGAHLVVVADADENDEVDGRFSDPIWIGYTDAASEGQFTWVTSSPSTFHRWTSGTPTNDLADCAVLQSSGTWLDVPCGDSHAYACECDPAPP